MYVSQHESYLYSLRVHLNRLVLNNSFNQILCPKNDSLYSKIPKLIMLLSTPAVYNTTRRWNIHIYEKITKKT